MSVKMAIIKKTRDKKCWKGDGKRKPLCTVGGIANWLRYYSRQYGGSSKNFKTELLYDPEVPLPEIHET